MERREHRKPGMVRPIMKMKFRINSRDGLGGSNWEIPNCGSVVNEQIILGYVNGIRNAKKILKDTKYDQGQNLS